MGSRTIRAILRYRFGMFRWLLCCDPLLLLDAKVLLDRGGAHFC
jgi:hypothetical protein